MNVNIAKIIKFLVVESLVFTTNIQLMLTINARKILISSGKTFD